MSKVMIDPGHAPGNVNRGPTGYYEYAGNWQKANILKEALTRCGMAVGLTRAEQEDPSLTARGSRAQGHDLFLSYHDNSGGGTARGCEVFYSVRRPGDKAFAAELSAAGAKCMGNPDRGAKVKESAKHPGEDYYTVIDAAERTGCPHIVLLETGFHDNPADEAWLKDFYNLIALCEAHAVVICKQLGAAYVPPAGDNPAEPDPRTAPSPVPDATEHTDDRPQLARGSKGSAVKELQTALNARGAGLAVDGDFGPKTDAAVRAFQKTNSLVVDGIVGPKTWAALDAGSAPAAPIKPANPYPAPTENLRKGNKGDGVRWVQWELNQSGAGLAVDGVFGDKTDAAVRTYQKNRGLVVDGIVGPKTRAALGADH